MCVCRVYVFVYICWSAPLILEATWTWPCMDVYICLCRTQVLYRGCGDENPKATFSLIVSDLIVLNFFAMLYGVIHTFFTNKILSTFCYPTNPLSLY